MKPMNLVQVVRNIDRRLERVEQILPTLPTREELTTLGERLDARITEEAERSRRHTQVLFESLMDRISIDADGFAATQTELKQTVHPKLADHDRRITALEDARGPTSGPSAS